MANLAYLTASGLVRAGDKIANAKVPSKGRIQYSVDNIRRNIANTINPDKWSLPSSSSPPPSPRWWVVKSKHTIMEVMTISSWLSVVLSMESNSVDA